MKNLITAVAIASALIASHASAQEVADLNDLEMAHVAYTADNIDIRYAHLALSYCQIWCLRLVGHAAIWSFCVASIPSLNLTPVMTLAR